MSWRDTTFCGGVIPDDPKRTAAQRSIPAAVLRAVIERDDTRLRCRVDIADAKLLGAAVHDELYVEADGQQVLGTVYARHIVPGAVLLDVRLVTWLGETPKAVRMRKK